MSKSGYGRLGVIRHQQDDFELYRRLTPASRLARQPQRESVSHISLEELEWLSQTMPRMGRGEIVEFLSDPSVEKTLLSH